MKDEAKTKRQLTYELEELRRQNGELKKTSLEFSKTLEALLKSSGTDNEIKAALLENASDVVLMLDMDANFLYFNSALMKMTGYTREELLARKLSDIEPPEYAKKIKFNFAMLLEKGEALFESAYLSKDGKVIFIEVHAIISRIEDKTVVISSVRDITELKQAQEKLKKAYAELEIRVQERTTELLNTNEALEAEIAERKKAEKKLKESEAKYRALIETTDTGFVILNKDGLVLDANSEYIRLTGHQRLEEILGRSVIEWTADHDRASNALEVKKCFEKGFVKNLTIDYADKNGKFIPIEINAAVVDTESGLLIVTLCRDITERKKLEAQLLQSQKMESIGLLAGGIAHDINNILGAIIGFTTLAQMQIKEEHLSKEYLDHIPALTDRASTLIKNLMVFSRKQVLDIRPLSLNDTVDTMGKFLERIIGEHIKLNLQLSETDIVINADSGQLEQALMNLATNARDAMSDGGILTISTEPFEMDENFINMHGYGKTGKYALLTVEDTGMGIDEETMEKIFEPFFTTKGVGKGTGLGLAMVYSTIKQHDGYIDVYSELGKGTTFRIYLPSIDSEAKKTKTLANIPLKGGTETILLVEDEVSLRMATRNILGEFGYKVIEAEDGNEAVKKYKEQNNEIHLVIMDVVMPSKSGKDAYRDILKIQPDVKIIFTSGHAEEILTSKKIVEEGLNFIPKPISPKELLEKIRDVLDKGKA